MQRGIVRTDIVVHDNIMTVSDFGVAWNARAALNRSVAIY